MPTIETYTLAKARNLCDYKGRTVYFVKLFNHWVNSNGNGIRFKLDKFNLSKLENGKMLPSIDQAKLLEQFIETILGPIHLSFPQGYRAGTGRVFSDKEVNQIHQSH